MPRFLTTLVALTLLAAAAPQPASAQAPADPGGPLVYAFVLDALDGDRVDAGGAPFISSLLAGRDGARSTYFRESRAIMVAETNPNHAAMATGAYAGTSGIPGNSFAVYAPSDGDTCPDGPVDERSAPTTTDGTDPACLRAESIFEAVRRQDDSGPTVTAGIFGKPKLASLFASRKVSGDRYDADHLWTPCVSPSEDEPYCKQVPNRGFDEYSVLDSTVMDEVLRTVREGVPGDGRTFTGGGRRPNLTFVNFPAIDNSGHATGAGAEYDAAITRADQQIQRFVTEQKRLGLWQRTVMVLLSDHSMDTTPQKTTLAVRFQAAGIPSSAYKIVQNGSAALVYLTDRTDPARFVLLKRMRDAATDNANPISALGGPPAVEALYREPNPADGDAANTVAARHPSWRLTGPRVGDLVVSSQRSASFNDPVNPLAGNHGGPQTRDSFFAVTGGSDLVNQRTLEDAADPLFDDTERNPDQAENVDLAPTVMRLRGLAAPAQNEGRFLGEAFRADRLPAVGAFRPVARRPCAVRSGFSLASATGSGRGVRFSFIRRVRSPVTVDLFQSSTGRLVLGNRLVARFTGRTRSFTWSGRRGLSDGYYFARLQIRRPGGRMDTRRIALVRRDGRFSRRPSFAQEADCGVLRAFKLERPVLGGRRNQELDVSYRLGLSARVTVDVLRGTRVVRRLGRPSVRPGGRTFRLRLPSERVARGDVKVRIRVVRFGLTTTAILTARRL